MCVILIHATMVGHVMANLVWQNVNVLRDTMEDFVS